MEDVNEMKQYTTEAIENVVHGYGKILRLISKEAEKVSAVRDDEAYLEALYSLRMTLSDFYDTSIKELENRGVKVKDAVTGKAPKKSK